MTKGNLTSDSMTETKDGENFKSEGAVNPPTVSNTVEQSRRTRGKISSFGKKEVTGDLRAIPPQPCHVACAFNDMP